MMIAVVAHLVVSAQRIVLLIQLQGGGGGGGGRSRRQMSPAFLLDSICRAISGAGRRPLVNGGLSDDFQGTRNMGRLMLLLLGALIRQVLLTGKGRAAIALAGLCLLQRLAARVRWILVMRTYH